jgi:S-formylglutathione hydrolase FrmB
LPLTELAAISGISMGGHGALTVALGNPGRFRSASSVSGVVDLTLAGDRPALATRLGSLAKDRARWLQHSAVTLLERAKPELALRLSCGDKDRWIGANRAFRARAAQLKVPLAYDEAPAGHDWSYWQRIVPEHIAWHAAQVRVPPG